MRPACTPSSTRLKITIKNFERRNLKISDDVPNAQKLQTPESPCRKPEPSVPSTKLFFGFAGKRIILALIGKGLKRCMRSELLEKSQKLVKGGRVEEPPKMFVL